MTCDICGDNRTIRLPVRQPLAVKVEEHEPIEVRDFFRDYPCPECSTEFIPAEKLSIETVQSPEMRSVSEEDREKLDGYVRQSMALELGDFLLRHDLIRFEEKPGGSEVWPTIRVRATVAVAAPKRVMSFEERVNKRQFEMATKLVDNVRDKIEDWGHEVGARNISKGAASDIVHEELVRLIDRMKPKKETEI